MADTLRHLPKKPQVEAQGTCERCGNLFSFIMTTKRHKACDDCKRLVHEEGKKRRTAARAERIKAAADAARAGRPVKKEPKLIRYAGYESYKHRQH